MRGLHSRFRGASISLEVPQLSFRRNTADNEHSPFDPEGDCTDLPNPPISEPIAKAAKEHASTPLHVVNGDNPFQSLAISGATRVKQVWAVGGGKGGVGKSLVATSLAISLARAGNRVVAMDLDLGGANLHTALGVAPPQETLNDFISGRVTSLSDCLSPSPINNLQFISGAQDSVGASEMTLASKVMLMEKIRELDADYVIFDLGAGTSKTNLDFFLYSDIGTVVLLPEPTSIENVYRFIKSAYYRRLMVSSKLSNVRNLIETAMDSKNSMGLRTPSDLFKQVTRVDPEAGMMLKDEIEKIEMKLIVNQARTQTDIDIGFSAKSVCKKYFGIDMDYVGYLDYDSAVWQAVRRKKPLMTEFPNSQLVSNLDRITSYLVKRYGSVRNSLL